MAQPASPAQMLRQAAAALEQRSDEDILDIEEAAGIVRRPVQTLRYWRYRKTGPPSFKLGARVMYRYGALRAWIAEQEAAGE